ncbi:hypothetical protein M404DRAFT_1002720 [Pisolithus tinctorius Marx 270]|uniref:Uncharacterized protein n=1 Tax=Pisolithus tinctorius Marx 270 TaxID=870435 RepID=A0A0C3P3B6_PISTI|nr:hypothetical protein M404DRAFT_1002720 [Pisolithus tinctorius Marx 270]
MRSPLYLLKTYSRSGPTRQLIAQVVIGLSAHRLRMGGSMFLSFQASWILDSQASIESKLFLRVSAVASCTCIRRRKKDTGSH